MNNEPAREPPKKNDMLPFFDIEQLDDSVGIINAIVFVINALSWKFLLAVLVGLVVTAVLIGYTKRLLGCAVALVVFTPTFLVLFICVSGVVMRVFTTIDTSPATASNGATATGGVAGWLPDINEAVSDSDVPASFVVGIMTVESAGNANAVSNVGALGLMQVMPATAAEPYICPAADLTNPQQNIACGVTYIEWAADVLNIDMGDGLTDGEANLLAMAYHGGATGALSPRPIDIQYAADVVAAMSMSQGISAYPNGIAATYEGNYAASSNLVDIIYGGRQYTTIDGRGRVHDFGQYQGSDYRAGEGTPLYSPCDGVVSSVNPSDVYGNPLIDIRCADGMFVRMLHGDIQAAVGMSVDRNTIVMLEGGIGSLISPPGYSHLHLVLIDGNGRVISDIGFR